MKIRSVCRDDSAVIGVLARSRRLADSCNVPHPPYWGRGYATAAVGQVLERSALEHGLLRLHARCLADNDASLRVLRKNGFRFVDQAQPRLVTERTAKFFGRAQVLLTRALADLVHDGLAAQHDADLAAL